MSLRLAEGVGINKGTEQSQGLKSRLFISGFLFLFCSLAISSYLAGWFPSESDSQPAGLISCNGGRIGRWKTQHSYSDMRVSNRLVLGARRPEPHSLPLLAFTSLARIWGECSTIHSPPALFFVVVFSSGNYLAQTNFTFYVRISPQWLSELR